MAHRVVDAVATRKRRAGEQPISPNRRAPGGRDLPTASDRLDEAFDGTQLVADAGLVLPATLAGHLGLKGLVDEHLDLGRAPGRANAGDKLLTLINVVA